MLLLCGVSYLFFGLMSATITLCMLMKVTITVGGFLAIFRSSILDRLWNKRVGVFLFGLLVIWCYLFAFTLPNYIVSTDLRLVLWFPVPALIGVLMLFPAVRWWGLRGLVFGFLIYLLFIYVLVAFFIQINLVDVGLCDHDNALYKYDPDRWGAIQTVFWPYMVIKGEHIPDTPCYFG